MSNRAYIEVTITKTRNDPTEYMDIKIFDDYETESLFIDESQYAVILDNPKSIFLYAYEHATYDGGREVINFAIENDKGITIEDEYFEPETLKEWLTEVDESTFVNLA